ncbi:MAG: MBL fold metallo-hydrolase [Anaerolineales bacterium]|nr:MBL fold metallo-hydrolase [Anaerolineales bacterium]
MIYTIDTHYQGRERATAVYLVAGPAGPLLIETGPGSTLPYVLTGLKQHGYEPADIQHVLVTHIHLDHAGAAGWWARQGAQIYVHERGAPHLIDPSKLINSASRIYGDRMDELWGETLPAPAEQVTVIYDGERLKLNGVEILVLETPGHANHHHAYRIGDECITGDSAGIHLPGSPFVDIPAPPPEFHRERWLETVKKLQAQNFSRIHPTHFGAHDNVAERLSAFALLIDDMTEFIGDCLRAGYERDEIVARLYDWVQERLTRGGADEAIRQLHEVANPFAMAVDGISRYWHKYGGLA